MFCSCGGETKLYKVTRKGFTMDGSECKWFGRRSLLQSDFDKAYEAHCGVVTAPTQSDIFSGVGNDN